MVYRRQQRRGTDTQMHPTYEKILNTGVEILLEHGFDRFNIQEVLERAEVSRGTLYHHFGDVDALIEGALVASYSRELKTHRDLVFDLIERCKTATEFRREVKRILGIVAATPASVRLRRAHTIALCETRPDLKEAIRAEQDENNRDYEEIMRRAQAKGFARKDLDPRVGAALMQGVGISRITDEVSSDPLSDERWVDLTYEIYEKLILDPGK